MSCYWSNCDRLFSLMASFKSKDGIVFNSYNGYCWKNNPAKTFIGHSNVHLIRSKTWFDSNRLREMCAVTKHSNNSIELTSFHRLNWFTKMNKIRLTLFSLSINDRYVVRKIKLGCLIAQSILEIDSAHE